MYYQFRKNDRVEWTFFVLGCRKKKIGTVVDIQGNYLTIDADTIMTLGADPRYPLLESEAGTTEPISPPKRYTIKKNRCRPHAKSDR